MKNSFFIFLDFIFITLSFVIVRSLMVLSPLFNTKAEQWNQLRYWIVGILAAFLFFILSKINGFYRKLNDAELKKLPLINLINCGIIFCLGIITCLQYFSVFDEQLFSKKVLFFALIVFYILTTFSRFILKN